MALCQLQRVYISEAAEATLGLLCNCQKQSHKLCFAYTIHDQSPPLFYMSIRW